MEAINADYGDRRVRRFLTDACEALLRQAWSMPEEHGGDVFGMQMRTVMLKHLGRWVGFFQVDRRSRLLSPGTSQVEYLWLDPVMRGRGYAEPVLKTMMAWAAPDTLFLRSPLHPAVQVVADRLGLPYGGDVPAEVAAWDMYTVASCRHGGRTCLPCMESTVRQSAMDMVRGNLTGQWAHARR